MRPNLQIKKDITRHRHLHQQTTTALHDLQVTQHFRTYVSSTWKVLKQNHNPVKLWKHNGYNNILYVGISVANPMELEHFHGSLWIRMGCLFHTLWESKPFGNTVFRLSDRPRKKLLLSFQAEHQHQFNRTKRRKTPAPESEVKTL